MYEYMYNNVCVLEKKIDRERARKQESETARKREREKERPKEKGRQRPCNNWHRYR
jgi:hypothetical protein